MRSDHLTRFVAERVAGSINDCLGFGDPASRQVDRNGRAEYHFRPGQIFAVVWSRRYPGDRQHRTLAIIEALPPGKSGRVLPGISPGVVVHVVVRQHGPAGQDEAVDQLIDFIEELKRRKHNPAQMPATFWIDAAQELLLCQMPLELFDMESMVCRA
ncbi:MAG TPA: DUF2840 domain-containing protein [Bryobacteraceae bacterium]|nr:DUF2840 domain-containing protein [Bryobacteraceae bacterium]